MAATSKKPDSGVAAIDPLDSRAARVAALDSLARRDHASESLRRKLRDKGYDQGIVETVVAALCTEKLVDDRRYVEHFIGFRAVRGQGPVKVRADLRQMGLPEAVVDESIHAYPDWMAQLRAARQKKFGAKLPTDYADSLRQARFLGNRGFTGAQIRLSLGLDIDLDEDM